MHKSWIFSKIKTAMLIGPFFAMFVCGAAHALDKSCADCYKCVQYSGTSCVRCEYDKNYCAVELDPIACIGYAKYNSATGKCECPENLVMTCENTWEYADYSDNVCSCVPTICPSGYYASAPNTCTPCPDPGFNANNDKCTVASDASKSNLSDGDTIPLIKYNGCYIPNECSGTDASGTFVLTGDCLHSSGFRDEMIGGDFEVVVP